MPIKILKMIKKMLILYLKKIIFSLFFVILIFQVSCENGQEGPIEIGDEVGFNGVTKQQCIEANGYWNECGSPCAGTGVDFCIQVCQVQCECGGIAGFGCPEGFKCTLSGKIADEMGVCVKE